MKKIALTIAAVLGFAAPATAEVNLDQVELFAECNARAAYQLLTKEEVLGCDALFTVIKLGFASDVDAEVYPQVNAQAFQAEDPEVRAAARAEERRINNTAYLAWSDWKVENAEIYQPIVEAAMAEARAFYEANVGPAVEGDSL